MKSHNSKSIYELLTFQKDLDSLLGKYCIFILEHQSRFKKTILLDKNALQDIYSFTYDLGQIQFSFAWPYINKYQEFPETLIIIHVTFRVQIIYNLMVKKKHLQAQLPDRILFAGSINSFETNTNNKPHASINWPKVCFSSRSSPKAMPYMGSLQ